MRSYLKAKRQDHIRRRRERYIIAILVVLISLLTYLGTQVFDLGLKLPLPNSILIFALINVNVILLLLLLFLTMRNLVKLFFERKKRIMGARLRSKLVLAFITLSLLPTIILFFVSVQFISTSIEYWFNLPLERSLKKYLEIGQDYYKRVTDEVLAYGNHMSRLITYHGYILLSRKDSLEKFISEKQKEYRLASIKVFSKRMELRAAVQDNRVDLSPFKNPGLDILRKSFEKATDGQEIQSSPHGDLVSGIVPIFSRTESKAVVGLIVLERFVPGAFVNKLQGISKGLQEFKQLKMLKEPIRIASGDYDFFIDLEAEDEIGFLVNSFNRMTMDLKNSKHQLEEANEELIKGNIELEQRRLYMEIVLANVGAGVVSADADGKILTINKSAERILNIKADDIIGKNYREVISKDQVQLINEFLNDNTLFRKGFMERQIRLSLENKTLTLLVSLNVLRDDQGKYLGLVAVFENFTEIERAQRLAAWREVARRIAHEKVARDDGKVFEECTNMIINQVEELKRLVNEFSSFARMPASNPLPNNISQIIKESVSLYKEAQRDVQIVFNEPSGIPVIKVDREQMKRVMINLLDNAIDAIDGNGRVCIELSHQPEQRLVKIEVADNGKGISAENKIRLFEPYFSTKKSGTGLGLAIVNTIISDHKGVIRIQDEKPRGTRFVIELPAEA
ncbi:MAG: PAS domain-containing protein [Deltaproteobacteria bacterium]|nr:PAS domain-containing protein [Deltaproteobacteria bacterium]